MSAVLTSGSSPRKGIVTIATAPCRYGAVLVAANDQGICDIQLGACRDELTESYHRWAKNEVHRIRGVGHPAWLEAVLNLTEDPTYAFDHPLDVQGTSFQNLVWHALCQVPAGQTTTYGELALVIDKPRAYRAVGAACGANRLALAIPCHRVLRKGSDRLDYRWGADIKQQILSAESTWVLDSQ